MGCAPRQPPSEARNARHRPDTPVPAPKPAHVRVAAPSAPPARAVASLRPPGLPLRRLLNGAASGSTPSPLLPSAAAPPQASRIPRPGVSAPTAEADGGGLGGGSRAAHAQVSTETSFVSKASAMKSLLQSDVGLLSGKRALSAIPDPKNLTTAARRVTAPTSAEKVHFACAASNEEESAAVAKLSPFVGGGEMPAAAKVWGGGMASRLIRFARGSGGKASPAEAAAGSRDSDGSASKTPSEQRGTKRPDTPFPEKRRSVSSATLQQRM